MYHSRRPKLAGLKMLPVRDTKPFSARCTPIWQVTEDSTRIVVLIRENQGRSMPNRVCMKWELPHCHMVSSPGAAIAVVALRRLK